MPAARDAWISVPHEVLRAGDEAVVEDLVDLVKVGERAEGVTGDEVRHGAALRRDGLNVGPLVAFLGLLEHERERVELAPLLLEQVARDAGDGGGVHPPAELGAHGERAPHAAADGLGEELPEAIVVPRVRRILRDALGRGQLVVAADAQTGFAHGEGVGGGQPPYVLVDRDLGVLAQPDEVVGDAGLVEAVWHAGREDRLDLRPENKRVAGLVMVIKRFDAEMVARAEELLLDLVPDGEGKVANEAFQARLPPRLIGRQDECAVGDRTRRDRERQRLDQRVPVVDPGVGRDGQGPCRVRERKHLVQRLRRGVERPVR